MDPKYHTSVSAFPLLNNWFVLRMTITITILITMFTTVDGQNYFGKIFTRDAFYNVGVQLVETDGRYFIYERMGCYNEHNGCTNLLEISTSGEILRFSDEINTYNSFGNMYYEATNDNFYHIGYKDRSDPYDYLMFISQLDGRTLQLEDDIPFPVTDSLNAPVIFKLTRYNDHYIVSFSWNINSKDDRYPYLFVLDLNFKLEKVIRLPGPDGNYHITEQYIDSEGNLNIHLVFQSIAEGSRTSIFKLDSDFNVIWNYKTNYCLYYQNPSGFEQSKDRTVFSITPFGNGRTSKLYFISRDYQLTVSEPWPKNLTKFREIQKLIPARDGGIWGCGTYGDNVEDNPKGRLPFIFKTTAEGKLLFEKYFTLADIQSYNTFTELKDMAELPDGSVMAIGTIGSEFRENGILTHYSVDLLYLHASPLGCLSEGECDREIVMGNFPTSTLESSHLLDGLTVYPNPANDKIYISNSEFPLETKLMNSQGQALPHSLDSDGSIDVSGLPNGLYVLNMSGNKMSRCVKLVVQH